MYRSTNFSTSSTLISFDIVREEAHKDITFELTVGHHPMAVRVYLVQKNFSEHQTNATAAASSSSSASVAGGGAASAGGSGGGLTPAALAKARASFAQIAGAASQSGIMFYANDAVEPTVISYRHQVRIRSRSDHSKTRQPAEIFSSEPLLLLSAMRGKLYMALHSVEEIANCSLVCYLDPPMTTVDETQDHFTSVWQICTSYVVSSANQAQVVQRIRARQHRMDDPDALRNSRGETPLHVIAANAADPALAKLLLSTGWKAFDANLLDSMGETPLIKLVQRPAVHDPAGCWHHRAQKLLILLIEYAGANLQLCSAETGDNVMHYAVRYHQFGGRILPYLLSVGGGHASILGMRNHKGVSPDTELTAPQSSATETGADGGGGGGGGDDENNNNTTNNSINDTNNSSHQVGGVAGGGAAASTPTANSPSPSPPPPPPPSSSSPPRSSAQRLQRFSQLHSLVRSGKDEALRLLASCDREQLQRRAQNILRVKGLPLNTTSDASAGYFNFEPEALKVPLPAMVDFGDAADDDAAAAGGGGADAEQRQRQQQRGQGDDGGDSNHVTGGGGARGEEGGGGGRAGDTSASPTTSRQLIGPEILNELGGFPTGHSSAFVPRKPVVRAKLATLIFERYDTAGTGFITRNQLLHAVHSYDSVGVPATAIDRVVDNLGIGTDGRVNLEEFALILMKLSSRG